MLKEGSILPIYFIKSIIYFYNPKQEQKVHRSESNDKKGKRETHYKQTNTNTEKYKKKVCNITQQHYKYKL